MTTYSRQEATSGRMRLLQLVDRKLLVKILSVFTNVTGLTANIVDRDGYSIFSKIEAQNNCAFCQLIWKLEHEKGIQRCKGAYARAGKQAALFNEPYIFRCPGGLVEWAAPIIVNGEHLGSIICGQVLMWEPEEFFWIELEEMNRCLTDDFEELFSAAKELQVVSGDKVQSASELLSVVANYIVNAAWQRMQQERELAVREALLDEEIATRKTLEEKLNSQSVNYYMEKEKSLTGKIRLGDLVEVRKIFKIILADIFSDQEKKGLAIFRARVFELLVIVSRAVVESGIDSEYPIRVNASFMQQLSRCYNIEEIREEALAILEVYLKELERKPDSKNQSTVEGIKGFIRRNYKKNLTLEEIAESVCLSSYYASRIFKESQKITIMEYLIQVRMNEAKRLLGNPKYKIDEVAAQLGYTDASYFSRVFKKSEGMTPTQFRHH